MKCLLLLTAFLAVIASSSAQENPDCGWYGNKTVAERNAMFPFNKAKKVVLVSYPSDMELNQAKADTVHDTAIKKVTFKMDEYRERAYLIKEEVVLSEAWVNQLSHVLVNYTLEKRKPGQLLLLEEIKCYYPRNSILFYDENDILLCCYEICFHCFGTKMYPDPDDVNGYAEICKAG
ncbi:MAG: hypothetical protein V4581_04595 [Bacteroidota bacterium]